jgi:hypothetical protein
MEEYMTLDKVKELESYLRKNYKQYATGWTYERSEGNFADCFYDGYDCGQAMTCYEIACIIGLDLPEPEEMEE